MWGSGKEWRGMFAFLVLLSQKQDPSRNESYNLIKMCKCVDYFWWFMDELLLPDSFSLCYFQPWAINIFFDMPLQACGIPSLGMHFFFSLFFWHTPWACGLPSLGRHLLFSFCIAQVVLESKVIEFLFLWMDVATISQCGSIACVRDLNQESMTSF